MSDPLFDYFIKVNLDDEHLNSNGAPEAYVSYRYPEGDVDKDMKPIIEHQIHLFCFPDPMMFPMKVIKSTDAYFEFVLTNVSGDKRYGFCYRELLGSGSKRWPVCFCFISANSSYTVFKGLLDSVVLMEKECNDVKPLLEALYSSEFPKHGASIKGTIDGHTYSATRATKTESLFGYDKAQVLLKKLDSFAVLSLFISLLLERRMIFISKSLSVLTSCIKAAVALLHPFAWQHVYIPILPPSMLDFACAPMPFVLGVLNIYCDTPY
eukprot:TRINITY_DN1260_c0_g1_i2.p1 TRINITY_DN1260_c0_g1~~TRINITY_DN1260_c0_g1_i2.p1  ORF type:complete len:266 (-),score=39.85 TRINITY_DN1260_c0_g1_i2:346-1143(-)